MAKNHYRETCMHRKILQSSFFILLSLLLSYLWLGSQLPFLHLKLQKHFVFQAQAWMALGCPSPLSTPVLCLLRSRVPRLASLATQAPFITKVRRPTTRKQNMLCVTGEEEGPADASANRGREAGHRAYAGPPPPAAPRAFP